jgi:hypothetical protein
MRIDDVKFRCASVHAGFGTIAEPGMDEAHRKSWSNTPFHVGIFSSISAGEK